MPLYRNSEKELIVSGSYAIFMLMLFLIIYHTKPQSLQTILLPQLVWLPTLFFINFRLFFPKEKEPTEDDNQDN
jgi:hypothetical protein